MDVHPAALFEGVCAFQSRVMRECVLPRLRHCALDISIDGLCIARGASTKPDKYRSQHHNYDCRDLANSIRHEKSLLYISATAIRQQRTALSYPLIKSRCER